MKITREINGQKVEIELTPNELWLAWSEEQRNRAYEYINYYIEDNFGEDSDEPCPEMSDEDRDDIVEYFLEEEDSEWEEHMQNAFERVVL